MLLRRIARPLFASWFLAEGIDVVRRPATHVHSARTALDQLSPALQRAHADVELSDRTLTGLVRAHGAATAGAATLLALGRLPRFSGAVLAGLTLPLALAELAGRRAARTERKAAGARRPNAVERAENRRDLLRPLALTGGALIVAADTAGKPSVRWRVEHARAAKAAAQKAEQAREALHRD